MTTIDQPQVFFLSTAEEESNYFTGTPEPHPAFPADGLIAAGTYRVVNGELFRVVSGPADFTSRSNEEEG